MFSKVAVPELKFLDFELESMVPVEVMEMLPVTSKSIFPSTSMVETFESRSFKLHKICSDSDQTVLLRSTQLV